MPNGFVVKKSSIPNAGLGVWTLKNISECVIIGPYGGERVYNKDDSTLVYAWEVCWHLTERNEKEFTK